MVTAADDARLAALEAKLDDVQEGQRQILVRLDAFDARSDTTQHEINSRLDTMQHEMNSRFDSTQREINARFDSTQRETNSRFESTQRETNSRFDSLQHQINARFDRLHIAIWTVGGGIIVMLMGLLIAQVVQGSS